MLLLRHSRHLPLVLVVVLPMAPQGKQGMVAARFKVPTLKDPVPSRARHSLDKAVRWLLRAQNRDGSWGDNPQCRGDISNTAIATLALMSMDSTVSRGRYSTRIRVALDYVLRRVKPLRADSNLDQSTLIQYKLGQNIDLYLAALLLSQVSGLETPLFEEKLVRSTLRNLSERIAGAQLPSGAFEQSYEPMLTTVTAWLALRQAFDAGITIHRASPRKVVSYLKRDCFNASTGIFREAKWNNQMRFVTQAGGLRVLNGSEETRSREARLASSVLMKLRFDQDVGGRAGGEEFLGAVFATQAFQLAEGPKTREWYDKISAALIQCQNGDGSWFGHHCITGRVFCTACSIITLSAPRKHLPMGER